MKPFCVPEHSVMDLVTASPDGPGKGRDLFAEAAAKNQKIAKPNRAIAVQVIFRVILLIAMTEAKPSYKSKKQALIRSMNGPTIAATISRGIKVPTHAIYRGTPGIYGSASTEKRDRSPSIAGDRESVVFVSTTSARIHHQPSSTGTTATTSSTATATTDRDAHAG